MPLPLLPSDVLVPALVVTVSMTAAAIDVQTRRVPNVLTGATVLLGLVIAAAGAGRVGLAAALAGGLVGLGVMLPGYLLGGTGGGDVKLLAGLGTLLGPGATLRAFVAMAIVGGVMAVLVAIRRRRLLATMTGTAQLVVAAGTARAQIEAAPDNRFAYAPAVAAGAIVAAFLG